MVRAAVLAEVASSSVRIVSITKTAAGTLVVSAGAFKSSRGQNPRQKCREEAALSRGVGGATSPTFQKDSDFLGEWE